MPEKQGLSKSPAGNVDNGVGAEPSQMPTGGGEAVTIYATFPTLVSAKALAHRLIEDRLAACVNLIPGMLAIYAYEGALHEDAEVVAIIKTQRSCGAACIAAICDGHPYVNPAVLQIEVSGGAAAYIDWLIASTAAAV